MFQLNNKQFTNWDVPSFHCRLLKLFLIMIFPYFIINKFMVAIHTKITKVTCQWNMKLYIYVRLQAHCISMYNVWKSFWIIPIKKWRLPNTSMWCWNPCKLNYNNSFTNVVYCQKITDPRVYPIQCQVPAATCHPNIWHVLEGSKLCVCVWTPRCYTNLFHPESSNVHSHSLFSFVFFFMFWS